MKAPALVLMYYENTAAVGGDATSRFNPNVLFLPSLCERRMNYVRVGIVGRPVVLTAVRYGALTMHGSRYMA